MNVHIYLWGETKTYLFALIRKPTPLLVRRLSGAGRSEEADSEASRSHRKAPSLRHVTLFTQLPRVSCFHLLFQSSEPLMEPLKLRQ